MEEFGTDAFRFTLTAFAAQGRDIKMSEDRIEGYRHFINKLWNASRFCLTHLSDIQPEPWGKDAGHHLSMADRWILSRLNGLAETVTRSLDEYRFNDAAAARFVLWSVLNEILRLLHPFIPFVTEEIWHKLCGNEGSIMKAEFPSSSEERHDDEAEAAMDLLMGITTGIRSIRAEMNVPPSLRVEAIVQSPDKEVRQTIEEHQEVIVNLAKLDTLKITAPGERPDFCAMYIFGSCTVFVSLKDIIDFGAEQARLNKELAKINKELDGVGKKLGNEDFLKKAPQDVVERVRAKRDKLSKKKNKVEGQLSAVSQLASNA
jgi:valyl-tRNA synthetase